MSTMPDVAELTSLLARLSADDLPVGDGDRVELLAMLEALKGACAAAQARVTVAFDASQRSAQAAQGVPAKEHGRGGASQVALARKDSPVKRGRHLGLARALVTEMPRTLAALASGSISEWRATIMVRETATLSAEQRAEVDRRMGPSLGSLGDRGLEREARKLAYTLEPGSVLRRSRTAREDRRVSLRPAPDTMSYLTGFLPVEQGVAVHTALRKHADAMRADGDSRSRGQIMADTLVERLTGQREAPAVPIEIQLVMTDQALLGHSATPARLVGSGPIPAALARSLIRATAAATGPATAWVRRLYTSPADGQLVAMDSRRRLFPAGLRRLLVRCDEVCRTPWCDAPIRHADHLVRAADGGTTSAGNGQGLCQGCNLAKEAPGWSASVSRAGPRHQITVQTPTGHGYVSTAPDPPREPSWLARLHGDVVETGEQERSPGEEHLAELLAPA